MLTSEDLQAIAVLIKAETDAIRKDMATKADIRELREYLENKLDLNAKIFKVELAATKKEIMHEVNKGLKPITLILKRHEDRIQTLEGSNLPKHSKN
jgi:hypothetical protein